MMPMEGSRARTGVSTVAKRRLLAGIDRYERVDEARGSRGYRRIVEHPLIDDEDSQNEEQPDGERTRFIQHD